MNFWENLRTAIYLAGDFHWVALGFVLAALSLYLFVPGERTRVRTSIVLFAVAGVGLLSLALMLSLGAAQENIAFRSLKWTSLLVESIAIINLASIFLFDVALNSIRLKPPRILRDLLLATAYLVIAFILLSRSGFDLTGIVATSAVITAVIGFSLADTLGNIMGGMALQMEHTINIGDWVRIEQVEGRVKEIRWRQTSIETRDWDTIVFPNSVLMKGRVTLLGQRTGEPRQHRRWVYFNVDFRYAPSDVIQAVEVALNAEPIPRVAENPALHCLVIDFKESYAAYAVRYWLTDLSQTDPTDSLVRSRIYSALRRADIPLSIPARSIFVTEETEKRRERKLSMEISKRVEALKAVELFHGLTEEELRALASRLKVAPFVRGEVLTKQGAEAHWLYIIIKGTAEIHITVNGQTENVGSLGEGEFFGEMGMMMGEPRSATVAAVTDMVCYRLDKSAFQDIISRRPEIAENISHVLARRRVELDAIREELNEESKRVRMGHTQVALLDRIREFFRLGDHNSLM
ncbi:MAG TPA: mechanosensitive ion channel family protein [Blastocatellia bacterium]|nr:mechanosensitive ion channel family protein [Blastocatellia bacterium]